jgi:hypothetical protein
MQGRHVYDAAPGLAKDGPIFDVISSLRRPTIVHVRGRVHGRQRGQSMAEFGLVIPILLVLFVAIADFGRVFNAGVTVEAATRNAAEATANEYLANPPGPLDAAAPGSNQPYYDALHTYAAKVVCAELRSLPSTNYDPVTESCPDMPLVLVCIHDSADAGCATLASPGSASIPTECTDFSPAPANTQSGTALRWVEVRTCYHFTNILQLPLFSFGDVWLQRTRNFTIPCYFVLGTDECGA